MEKAGKVLVLVNVGFSLLLAAVAGVLAYNRVDWTNSPAKEGQPEGELVKRAQRLKEYQASVKPAEAAWRAARAELPVKEDRLRKDREWYAAELERLSKEDNNPIVQVEFTTDNGQPTGKPTGYYKADPDPKNGGRPNLVAVADRYGKPLHAMPYYVREEKRVHGELVKELAALDAAKKKDADLTEQLIGGPKWGMGLIKRIEAEKVKRGEVIAEQKWLEPLRVNTFVETELILQRKKALEARVKELEAAPAP
jgi:hypothetical protein